MNKKLLLSTLCISLLHITIHFASATDESKMILPADESGVYKWSPFRMTSHAIWGNKLGQDFWEANSTELNTALNSFKEAESAKEAKVATPEIKKAKLKEQTVLLKNVMEKSAAAYEQVINTLQTNYRTAMSYIVEKFQAESPSSTILYFPDNKLVALMPKNASDEEKYNVMHKLLKETSDIVKAKKGINIGVETSDVATSIEKARPSGAGANTAAAGDLHVHVHAPAPARISAAAAAAAAAA
jgi:hypothetical protein